MKAKSNGTVLIINSLLWAAAMIGAAIILSGTDLGKDMFYLLLTLWMVSFFTMTDSGEKSELACLRRFLQKQRNIK